MKIFSFLFIFGFLLSVPNIAFSYVNNTYYETTNLTVIQTATYQDESILVLFGALDELTEIILEFRVIFPNGTMIPFSVRQDSFGRPVKSHNYQIHALKPYYFMLGDTLNITTIVFSLLDWNGNILAKNISSLYTYFDQLEMNSTNSNYQQWKSLPYQFSLNVDPDKGFLVLIWNISSINWATFQYPNQKGEISLIAQDTILVPQDRDFMDVRTFSLVDGGYAITQVVWDMSVSISTRNGNVDPGRTWDVSVVFIHLNSTPQMTQPFLIYQTPELLDSMFVKYCYEAFQGSGYECLLSIVYSQSYLTKKLLFLTSGANIGSSTLFNLSQSSASFHAQSNAERPLPYGGLGYYEPIPIEKLIVITVIQPDSIARNISKFPYDCGMDEVPNGVYLNNSVWMVVNCPTSMHQWSLISEDMPRFIGDDLGYHNLAINLTDPPIDASIPVNLMELTISYDFPVVLSNQNISIFRSDGDIFRQMISAQSESCSVSGGQNVICTILQTTFNQPNTEYYIVVDPDFTRSAKYNEPLPGIKKGLWKFKTQPDDTPKTYADTASVLMRLTKLGTESFLGLPAENRSDFLNQLQFELAKSVPIDSSRIEKTTRFQPDPQALDQLLLKFAVITTKSPTDMNVQQILDTLKRMLKDKKISPIGRYSHTALLDETYGLTIIQNLWENYKMNLIYLAVGVLLIGLIAYFAHRRNPKGKSFSIFKVVLIIIDLLLDVLFVVNNGKDVRFLYIPAIITLVVPIAVNSIFAFLIFVREFTSNPQYVEWYSKYRKIVSMFTFFSAADIEILLFLNSQFGGFLIFNAPFTQDTLKRIFWGSSLNIIIENIPQFVIQILYFLNTISYDIVPLLTLVTSSIILLNDIISIIYEVIKNSYN